MNSRRILWLILACIAALALGAWLWTQPVPQPAPLAGSNIGGPFALTDQRGRAVTDANLRGKYALIYFGYTFCPDVCPLDMQHLTAGLQAFEKADPARGAKVRPVFVTVDPARDTVAVLREYAANFHPRLLALTGSEAAIEQAKRAYRIYARRAGTGPDYLVDHLALIYLIGPDGKAISYLQHAAPPAQIAAELDKYVR
jgi:protein SCO1/2